MLRQLNIDEIPKLFKLGRLFFELGKVPGEFNEKAFLSAWQGLIQSKVGAIFVLLGGEGGEEVHGAIGAVHFTDMNTGDLTATENFWIVDPKFRGRGPLLLEAYENWAREKGCKRCGMIHLLNVFPDSLKALYERRCYRPVETNYLKELV